jgi:transcriptional regulator with XRE-family HTH domain
MSTTTEQLQKKDLLKDQLVNDINEHLAKFRDYSLGQKSLAKKAGVHAKTIQRLCRKEHFPSHITLLKVYKVLLGESCYETLYSLLPDIIRSVLDRDQVQIPEASINYSQEIKREILNDRVFLEIYFLVDAGVVTNEFIQFKFGEHGLDTVKRMINLKALKYNSKGQLELGAERVQLDPSLIKHAGLILSKKYSKTENCEVRGENFVALYVESLPSEAYQEWLSIDKEAFLKKAEIAKKYKNYMNGSKVFTYMTTDTFQKGTNEVLNH